LGRQLLPQQEYEHYKYRTRPFSAKVSDSFAVKMTDSIINNTDAPSDKNNPDINSFIAAADL